MNRRKALRHLATAALATPLARAQAAPPRPYRVVEVAKLEAEWSFFQFPFDGRHALLLRVPRPPEGDTRSLAVEAQGATVYLVAYHLICTHLGCTPSTPNAERQLVCPCHGSRFHALDGRAADGRPNPPLRAIALEVRDGVVFATGYR
ncbi:ubiquinol-cytochrome c reductase iron-sulfur subunit [Calidithermus chliarophilus]|uniref:QcrA and Rieske domain-containing protein n=1 Tax=Calidithermus chliarophilus TaxID=52023 RepID=UPI00040B8CF8|nr:Rieske 2Fe-2S domain-containing protein [Calidithermus chliarophilus]